MLVNLFVSRIAQKTTHPIFADIPGSNPNHVMFRYRVMVMVMVIPHRTVLQLGEGRIMLRNIAEVCALLCAVMFYV